MKNFRYVLVGFVFGAAFGAKVGAFLTNLLDGPASFSLIESGFTYGALVGSSAAVIFMIAFALANSKDQSKEYRAQRIVRSI
ncbi:hypothetical protein [Ekhidna sp.]|uniref:hypothetical protein n=1 Tax=Ekhidna sp. TaxID=2608089 RepID=UPI003CCBFD68